MKKIFNIILSLATIAYFAFYIYALIKGVPPFENIGKFVINYGAIILLGLFTFNNLLAKVMSVFLVLFIIAVVVLIILFVNPSLITGATNSIIGLI